MTLQIDTGGLASIAGQLRIGGRALDAGPDVTSPDAGGVSADITASLAALCESTGDIAVALSAMGNAVTTFSDTIGKADQNVSDSIEKTVN